MNACDGPSDTGESVGVTAVEVVGVVKVDGDLVGLGGGGRPFENFLGPVHAHVAVHFSGGDHFYLSSIPRGVMGEGLF